eukprot:CAMPEP_0171058070 /NCGR_PEP_ID=MMETSP0766_2-20121228/2242_1 /TAXON_ID=439317 /ORGANISM="Gambierdiscus australes, Strain CAWD 149" /LENGTH=232 /DNA_ID=CAMNT_0011513289 /DNA_START=134 /DNA_END=829 /DNA_ORIENTATION=-
MTFSTVAASGRSEVPVKSTFIHFDIPLHLPMGANRRSATCPARFQLSGVGWEAAMQELCQAMAPRRQHLGDEESTPPVQQQQQRGQALKEPLDEEEYDSKEGPEDYTDGVSEISTKANSGSGTPGTPGTPSTSGGEAVVQEWTSISPRKRPAQARLDKRAAGTPPRQQQVSSQHSRNDALRCGIKGKGLSYFERINVGIEDDRDFRVVQRLIGPRGKHMQDITTRCKGAKVW